MYVPLVILAVMAAISGWKFVGLTSLLEQARPLGTAEGVSGGLLASTLTMPAEHLSHAAAIHVPVSLIAFSLAALGFALALGFYGLRVIDAEDARRQFAAIHRFLLNKWWFDELYQAAFVRPALYVSQRVADVDRRGIDGVADGLAHGVQKLSIFDDWIDRWFVDGLVNGTARVIFATGLWLRNLQTGNLRQYVMFMAVGVVALFVLISLYWNFAFAG